MPNHSRVMNKKNRIFFDEEPIEENYIRNITGTSILCIVLAILFGYYHMYHIETLFENEKHFSHLSNLERELSFRTESGLYYYYFKFLVVDKNMSISNISLVRLVQNVMIYDNRTEYPTTINSLQRFNLYPELFISVVYRAMNGLGLLNKTCWKVDRGDMPPVDSCVGFQEPIYFYTKSVFVLHGFLVLFLFILCYTLNNQSNSSGIIGCLSYFYNHSEATRVMFYPALRENFAFPFYILQIMSLVYFIRVNSSQRKKSRNSFYLFNTALPLTLAIFSILTSHSNCFSICRLFTWISRTRQVR